MSDNRQNNENVSDNQRKELEEWWSGRRFLSDKAIAGKLLMDGQYHATQQDFIDIDNQAKSTLSTGSMEGWRKIWKETGKSGASFHGCFDPVMIKKENFTNENGEPCEKYTTTVGERKSLIVGKYKPTVPADKTSVQLPNLKNQTSTKSIGDFAAADATKTLKKPSSDEVVYSEPNLLPVFRKDVIKNNEQGFDFTPAENIDASSEKPWHEFPFFSAVAKNKDLIDSLSKKHNVDSDLVKAIMYTETTHGYYDIIAAPLDLNKSVLPMNVNTVYWKDTFGTRKELKTNTAKNIEAGIKMLKAIIDRVQPNATIAQIATLYNSINATKVNDYGVRVQEIYDKKLWEQK